jgi:uncharacterized protein (TIGR02466 family)
MPDIRGLFPKFIYSDTLNISDNYNEEIKAEIYKITKDIKKTGESVTDFYSNNDVINNPVFIPLFSLIREHVSIFCNNIGCSKKLRITYAWVSVTYPGQCHDFHTHGVTDINGVYYVQATPPMNLMFLNTGNHLGQQLHNEPLETKKLLLFDGSLAHGFMPVSETKITIAFNITS